MKNALFFFPGLLYSVFADAQVTRKFIYQNQAISFLAQNNRISNDFSFPGMNVYIIVGESSATPEELYALDSLRQLPVMGMDDYTCFYYLSRNIFLEDTSIVAFIKAFITDNFKHDYVDRNQVHLIWKSDLSNLSCSTLKALHKYIASVTMYFETVSPACGPPVDKYISAQSTWGKNLLLKTDTSYVVPGLIQMESAQQIQRNNERIKTIEQWKGNFFFQLTTGVYNISDKYKTDFDTETLIDFTQYKTFWNITAGYYLTDAFSVLLNAGLIYSGKNKSIDNISFDNNQITINGSGSAGVMIRYGIGARLSPFHKKGFSPFIEVTGGGVSVMAGGGNGSRIIGGGSSVNITKQTQSSTFYGLCTGLNYRLSRIFYITANIQYSVSPLKEPIGSVTAFSGISFNGGIGFTIPFKKE